MIFNFLAYLKPVWYFNRRPATDFGYFPTAKQLKEAGYSLQKDDRYRSEAAKDRDLGWTAFQQGFISKTKEPGYDIWQKSSIPVYDEYIFLRKNFHTAWVLYVLIVRILTFNNPISEFFAFFKTMNVKRVDFSINSIQRVDFGVFKSELIASNPFVSVVIPTLNRYHYLTDVFKDLENQTYKNFEVIVVDQTDDFQESFYNGWNLNLRFWFQEEKALWKARNEAIQSAKGEYIAMTEDDVRFEPNWIENHLKCIDYFRSSISSGVFYPENKVIPKDKGYFSYSSQLATGNVMLSKDVFRRIGYFDRKFEKQRMGDGEFGCRGYINGILSISNPYASCVDIKAPAGGLRQMGIWDGWRPKKLFGPRPVPSVLYFSRKYFGSRLTKFYILSSILPSLVPYQFKGNRGLKLISFVLVPFLLPLVFFQVLKSWNLASDKLNEGEKITII